jgi:hypothetical protein
VITLALESSEFQRGEAKSEIKYAAPQ